MRAGGSRLSSARAPAEPSVRSRRYVAGSTPRRPNSVLCSGKSIEGERLSITGSAPTPSAGSWRVAPCDVPPNPTRRWSERPDEPPARRQTHTSGCHQGGGGGRCSAGVACRPSQRGPLRIGRCLIKLVADAGSDRLLGAHILAPEGADSIQTAPSRSGRASPSTTSSQRRSFPISPRSKG